MTKIKPNNSEEMWMPAQYIFKDGRVATFGNRYYVSSLGNVQGIRVKLLKQQMNHRGYMVVNLRAIETKRVYPYQVHRLVLSSFCSDSWFPGAVVCHGQDTGSNSRVENYLQNLRWGTDSDNKRETYRRDEIQIGNSHHAAYDIEWIQDLLTCVENGMFPIKRKIPNPVLPFSARSAAQWFNAKYGTSIADIDVRRWYTGEVRFDVRREFDDEWH